VISFHNFVYCSHNDRTTTFTHPEEREKYAPE